jgi:hypothetical protein
MPTQPGEFWVADIPFTDGTASKRRPVLVLWLDAQDAIVAGRDDSPAAVPRRTSRSPTGKPPGFGPLPRCA